MIAKRKFQPQLHNAFSSPTYILKREAMTKSCHKNTAISNSFVAKIDTINLGLNCNEY